MEGRKKSEIVTLDSGINVGVRLLIFEEEKFKKWPQCLDWCKKVIKF